jgi:hypothetical protein
MSALKKMSEGVAVAGSSPNVADLLREAKQLDVRVTDMLCLMWVCAVVKVPSLIDEVCMCDLCW